MIKFVDNPINVQVSQIAAVQYLALTKESREQAYQLIIQHMKAEGLTSQGQSTEGLANIRTKALDKWCVVTRGHDLLSIEETGAEGQTSALQNLDRVTRNELFSDKIPLHLIQRTIEGTNPIKVFRKFRRIKQIDLADRSGISQSNLSKIEAGKEPSIQQLCRISKNLDIDVRLLMSGYSSEVAMIKNL